jgi:hypothetical protein
MLEECRRSVAYQTYAPVEHCIVEDTDHRGNSLTTNECADMAAGEWFVPLADDDLLLPGAIEALLREAHHADVVYAPPLVTGNEDRWWFFQAPPAIPSFGLISAALWHELRGYDLSLEHEEDRDMWTRALDQGARFVRVDYPCWVYRQHAGNKSFNKVTA